MKKPSLESPNWWPITEALKQCARQTGSDTLACRAINGKLKAGQLRALGWRADGHRELLPPSAWGNLYCTLIVRVKPGSKLRLRRAGMAVFSRELGKRPPMQWFFVWLPDYKKIFGLAATPAEPRPQLQGVPEKRGKKPVHDRADLQSAALGLALRRKQGAPEKKPADVVAELREWCKRNKRKVPSPSTLYEIVAAAFRIKLTLKS